MNKRAHQAEPVKEEERVYELQRLAEIGKMSGGFIHDLANHITVMSLSMDRIERSLWQDSERLRQHSLESARARKNIKYLVGTIKKHIRGTDLPCSFSPEKKLKELLSLFKYKAEKERISLFLSVARETKGSRIYGSRLRFNQVFSNLIQNAIDSFEDLKAREKEETTERNIVVGIKQKNDRLVFSVQDNGSGMSAEIKDQIFRAFYTTKTRDKGTGLGLATVKDIVEKEFEGKIYVKSEESKGSTFFVEIARNK